MIRIPRFLQSASGSRPPTERVLFHGEKALRKRVARSLLCEEANRTIEARALAQGSGIFYVPRVLHVDKGTSEIFYEFLENLTPIAYSIIANRNSIQATFLAGLALGVIHKGLKEGIQQSGYDAQPADADPNARLIHGDYNTINVTTRSATPNLVVLDWGRPERCVWNDRTALPYLDVCHFIRSILVHGRLCDQGDLYRQTAAFINGYQKQTGRPIEAAELRKTLTKYFIARILLLTRRLAILSAVNNFTQILPLRRTIDLLAKASVNQLSYSLSP